MALVAGGARKLVVADPDTVETSNLQRQVLFQHADRGRPKARVAAQRIGHADPRVNVRAEVAHVDLAFLRAWRSHTAGNTVVLECTDSPALKFALNDACVDMGLSLVIGGVLGWSGQVMAITPGSACFRCVFEAPPPPELSPTCASFGVIGAAAGTIGFLMALFALRIHRHRRVAGRLQTIDLRSGRCANLAPRPRSSCPACGRRSHGAREPKPSSPGPVPRAKVPPP